MGEIDTFGVYVRQRMEHWGFQFALHRDCEYLGHQSKNMLQVLIDHKGEMPGRAQGFKPLETDTDAQQIEDMVTAIGREQMRIACSLRAYFCGNGRKKIERYETALNLIANAERDTRNKQSPPHVKRYLSMVDIGVAQIRGELNAYARAA